jgi:hypothetical protein
MRGQDRDPGDQSGRQCPDKDCKQEWDAFPELSSHACLARLDIESDSAAFKSLLWETMAATSRRT